MGQNEATHLLATELLDATLEQIEEHFASNREREGFRQLSFLRANIRAHINRADKTAELKGLVLSMRQNKKT